MRARAAALLERALLPAHLARFEPSLQAAAAIRVAAQVRGYDHAWLEEATGHAPDALRHCVDALGRLEAALHQQETYRRIFGPSAGTTPTTAQPPKQRRKTKLQQTA